MNNDLISREALKKAIKDNGYSHYFEIFDIIDNAPTVEGEILTKEAYSDLCLRASQARPQGEWEESHIFSCGNILRMQMDVIEHKCKNCGRWSIEWMRVIPNNFCSNCGAKMIGGAE